MATTALQPPTRSRSWSSELLTVLPGALLVLLMTGSVAYSLSISNWASGLDVLVPAALLALLVGLIFARLPWLPGWLAHSLSAALALVWTVQLIGPQMSAGLLSWRDHATDLLLRTLIWSRVIVSGGRGEDILLFVAALCLIVWALAYGTAWAIFRRGWAWRAMIVNALVALVNYTYVLPKPTTLFFVFLCAALLLLVYQNVLQRQAQWDAQQVEYPELLPLRFVWSAALVCGVLIVATALLPGNVSIAQASRTWQLLSKPFRDARGRWEDLFSTINAPPGAGSGAFTSRGAALSGARVLNDSLVMYVRSTEYDYWRAVAFDKYTGQGWQNTVGEQARASLSVGAPEQARSLKNANEALPIYDVVGRAPVDLRFQILEPRKDDLVMVAGTASKISLPIAIEHNYIPEGNQIVANYDETALIVAREPLDAGTTYTVTALMAKLDVQSLRATGADYPAWVRERYLQLPTTITQRTRDLATRIVDEAGAETPYDQAEAIQAYLRSYVYTETIPNPPAGQDGVDWFLFDQRAGYCDYYASSMVVMLRSLGVPARWARGYAGGEFDAERGLYVVRENVAHSWPEVYFPGVGWERFEPTPASYTSVPQRPLTPALSSDPSSGDDVVAPLPNGGPERFEDLDDGSDIIERGGAPIQETVPGSAWRRPLAISGSLLGLLGLLALAAYGRWRYEQRGLSRAAAAYAGTELLASWGGLGQSPQSTAQEYARTLGGALPDHQQTISQLVAAYEAERYQRRKSVDLPALSDLQALQKALLRRIFTTVAERLPQPRERR